MTLSFALAGLVAAAAQETPDNTWVHVKTARSPAGRSYSGAGGAIGGGRIFYFGGGHFSHPGNDVELYDIGAKEWVAATEAERAVKGTPEWTVIGGGSSPGYPAATPKGRPWVLHTYQLACYLPERKSFLAVYASGVWLFDPERREWTRLEKLSASKPRTGDVHTKAVVYDPDRRAPVYIANSADRGVFVLDLEKETWTRKAGVPEKVGWSEIYAAYDTARRRHVVWMGPGPANPWWSLDLAAGEWKALADLAGAWKDAGNEGDLYGQTSLSVAYDAANDLVVAAVRPKKAAGVELWTYDAARDAWSRPELRGDPPRGLAAWNLLNYDADRKRLVFLNVLDVGGGFAGGRTDGVFTLRLKK
jgi:hypothetical protein